jgi:uncharacterized protein (TIGR02147 family)
MRTRSLIDVYLYQDYRAFLRDYYERQKEQNDGFSLRAFSKRIGLRSPNYFKLVMDGERNLTPQMAVRFADGCGLSGEASDYFCELVAFNQARTAKERQLHYERIQRFTRYRKVHKLDAAQDAYHAFWYVPAIRELVVRSDFKEDPKWIARTLIPAISPTQAKNAVDVLLELGLLIRDRSSGRLMQHEPLIETPDGPLGHHVVQFHRAMMVHAADALDRTHRDEREIASLTLCLNESQMKELKAELQGIRESMLQRYQSGSDAERVVQLNFQMFPLSKKRSES